MRLRSYDPAAGARLRAGHLTRVRVLRRALPISAAVLCALCAVQIAMSGVAPPSRPQTRDVDTMVKPRFAGRGPSGKSFVITGSQGRRTDPATAQIEIVDPVLVLRDDANATKRMTARAGVFDEAAHALVLTGDVKMDGGGGARFAANQARIDTRTGAVSGQSGLRVESGAGVVQGGSYEADEQGDRLILKGGVRGRLTPRN
ncbi:LPS export ABC transporter periplasmic protein LptC [Phenylobacterium sp.]|uniref:LPS export ABC transporter periplasmic protein LptC n=1 Tax=Phenylobacterium sp. TaxID=1871053 RepID=UPI002FC6BCF1